jgi:hypothetical protein
LEKLEVGFALYRLDKAPGRFFGNLRNALEIAYPELVVIDSERRFGLFYFS